MTISGFTVTGATGRGVGVYLYSSYCNILNNTISNNYFGIYVDSSSNQIACNNVNSNNDGILLFSSSNNIISNNTASDNDYGIALDHSSKNTLINNIANSNNYSGICFSPYSSKNTLINNTANSNNGYGISLSFSSDNTLTNNTANLNNGFGIGLSSSSDNTLMNNIANSNNEVGIILSNSSKNTLTNNTANSNINRGIRLESSSKNTLTNNNANSNYYGIWLDSSSNNKIMNNNASNNNIGIYHDSSNYNMLANNNASDNNYGILLDRSNNNKIYLNNFINNSDNVYSSDSTNIWNSPSKITYTHNGNTFTSYLGNYWEDYQDKYPGAKERDNTGIWDTPYEIIEDKDNYPLVETSDNYIPTTAENGTLVVNVYNVNGDPAAKVKGTTMVELIESGEVFPIAEQTIDSESKATFLDVPVGEYYINVWHNPQVERGSKEFWGQQKGIAIVAGTTITIEFYRHNPYVEKFHSKKDSVEVNTSINIYVTIKVPPNYPDAEADVTASIDIEDKGGQIVCQIISEAINVQKGDNFTFSFSYTPTEEGTYYGLAKAYVFGVGELCTDNCGWIEIFRVGEKEYNPSVTIPTCAPNYEMGYVGTTFQFVVNVTNKGTAEDTIDLSVSNTWGAEISRDSLTLLSGESEYVYVNVTGKEAGWDDITVKATSRSDNSKYSELKLQIFAQYTNPLYIDMYRSYPLSLYSPTSTIVSKPEYVKCEVVDGMIIIFFDLNRTTVDIREAVISIKNVETDESVDLTIKLPDFDVIPTDFRVWEDGYNFKNWLTSGGNCYGIAETSILFFMKIYELSDFASYAKYTYEADKKDVERIIDTHSDNQRFIRKIQAILGAVVVAGQEEYKRLKEGIKSGEPMMLLIKTSSTSGHAVVAYKIVEIGNDAFIICYDNRYPYNSSSRYFQKIFLSAKLNKSTWKVFFEEKWCLFLAERAESMSEYIYIKIDCPVNATITDQYHRTIADNGTNEIPNASMFITNETKMFYLPAHMTYSVEIDAYDSGTFNFTRVSPIEKDISITKFENIPVTSNTKALVDIAPGVTDYTMTIDYEGDGTIDEERSPDVNDTIIVGQDSYPIQLHTGWNLISLPLTPEDTNVLNVLSSVAGNWNSVWSYEGGNWKRYDLAGPDFLNTLTIMEPGKGYWLHMKSDDTLSISGSEPMVKSIPLSAGWNLVGYNSLNSMPTTEAMSSVAGNWNSIWSYETGNWKRYDLTGSSFLNTLSFMEPGKGYWLNMKSPDTWTLGA